MSSAGRGAVRNEADFYPSPPYTVTRLMEHPAFEPAMEDAFGSWLEPCAGNGAIIRAVNSWFVSRRELPVTWRAVELREEMRPVLEPLVGAENVEIGSYLHSKLGAPSVRHDVILTNPPFLGAELFVNRALLQAKHVVMLLRLNFLGSEQRHGFFHRNMPANIFVLPNRPAFKGDGKTDSTEYAWFHWNTTTRVRHSKLHMLALTPPDERRPSGAEMGE